MRFLKELKTPALNFRALDVKYNFWGNFEKIFKGFLIKQKKSIIRDDFHYNFDYLALNLRAL